MATNLASEPKTERVARSTAQRVFAAEFEGATLEYKEAGEYAPTYIITPLGARINRLFFVGILTANEAAGAAGDAFKAQVSDLSEGTFRIYAGQYQPVAAAALGELRPPTVVAVMGKGRVYEVESKSDPSGKKAIYQSIRPESITVVDTAERDAWILDTAKHTIRRIECMREAMKMQSPTVDALETLGFAPDLADGVVRALAHYGPPDLARYAAMVRDALEVLLGGSAPAPSPTFAPASTLPLAPKGAPVPPPPSEESEALGEEILALVVSLDDGKGAPWEDVLKEAAKRKIGEAEVEEALNSLMDKGLVYEPVLGRLKRT